MDIRKFYEGNEFEAYEYLGAHLSGEGTVFRTYAPKQAWGSPSRLRATSELLRLGEVSAPVIIHCIRQRKYQR